MEANPQSPRGRSRSRRRRERGKGKGKGKGGRKDSLARSIAFTLRHAPPANLRVCETTFQGREGFYRVDDLVEHVFKGRTAEDIVATAMANRVRRDRESGECTIRFEVRQDDGGRFLLHINPQGGQGAPTAPAAERERSPFSGSPRRGRSSRFAGTGRAASRQHGLLPLVASLVPQPLAKRSLPDVLRDSRGSRARPDSRRGSGRGSRDDDWWGRDPRDQAKLLARLLRHRAPKYGIRMRSDGFVRSADLASKVLCLRHASVTATMLDEMCRKDPERFGWEVDEHDGRILVRALANHSIRGIDPNDADPKWSDLAQAGPVSDEEKDVGAQEGAEEENGDEAATEEVAVEEGRPPWCPAWLKCRAQVWKREKVRLSLGGKVERHWYPAVCIEVKEDRVVLAYEGEEYAASDWVEVMHDEINNEVEPV